MLLMRREIILNLKAILISKDTLNNQKSEHTFQIVTMSQFLYAINFLIQNGSKSIIIFIRKSSIFWMRSKKVISLIKGQAGLQHPPKTVWEEFWII